MPKITNWSKMDAYPGIAGWKHDEKRITLVIEGPNISRDGYRVVKRHGGGAFTVATGIKTQEKAREKAINYMENNPDPISFS